MAVQDFQSSWLWLWKWFIIHWNVWNAFVCSRWTAIEMLIFPLNPVDSYGTLLHSWRHVRLLSEKKGRKDSWKSIFDSLIMLLCSILSIPSLWTFPVMSVLHFFFNISYIFMVFLQTQQNTISHCQLFLSGSLKVIIRISPAVFSKVTSQLWRQRKRLLFHLICMTPPLIWQPLWTFVTNCRQIHERQ